MKRIGIIDHCLDNFHARVYSSALRGPLFNRGYQIVGATADGSISSRSWADANKVPYFESVDELASVSDAFMILAPSNPELHLDMCRQVFPLGKPTFVDKTFAPDLATARQIFELADQFEVVVQSTSALRSSTVQNELALVNKPLVSMFITCSGPTFAEYGIHPLELAVSCLGPGVKAVMLLGRASHRQVILQYGEGRSALIDFNSQADLPFAATLIFDDGTRNVEVAGDRLFVDAASSILDFFDAAQPQVDRAETLVIRELLDLLEGEMPAGEFVELSTSSGRAHVPPPHWQRQASKVRS